MKKMIVMMMVVACTATGLFASPVSSTTEAVVLEEAPECTITIKGTYDGKEVNLTVTLTADNCARAAGDLLRQIVKK